jgi:hypothetical protein
MKRIATDAAYGIPFPPLGERFDRLAEQLEIIDGLWATKVGDSRERTATVTAAPGPWLPSQTWPAAVEGAVPYVAPARGTLLLPPGAADYTLRWWEPQTDGDALLNSGVDDRAPGGLDQIGGVPSGMTELAVEATGRQRPSFRAALALEGWFRDGYRLAVGAELPAGHGWPQITRPEPPLSRTGRCDCCSPFRPRCCSGR